MNTSGISFYGGQDLTGTTIDGTYGYRAVGNYIYNVVCTVPYTAGGLDFVTDGNGISPDSLAIPNSLNPGLKPYLKRGLIDSNVIVGCGGRAVHIYNSKNIDVVNNTVVGNLRTKSPAINGSTEIDLALDVADAKNGVVIANNLIAPTNTTRAFDRSAQTVTANTAVGGTDAVPSGNQSLRSMGLRVFPQAPTASALAEGLAPTALVPVVATWVPRRDGSSGFGALGFARKAGSTVVVGALQHQ
jgi:parallel beta-helix repeat protein